MPILASLSILRVPTTWWLTVWKALRTSASCQTPGSFLSPSSSGVSAPSDLRRRRPQLQRWGPWSASRLSPAWAPSQSVHQQKARPRFFFSSAVCSKQRPPAAPLKDSVLHSLLTVGDLEWAHRLKRLQVGVGPSWWLCWTSVTLRNGQTPACVPCDPTGRTGLLATEEARSEQENQSRPPCPGRRDLTAR